MSICYKIKLEIFVKKVLKIRYYACKFGVQKVFKGKPVTKNFNENELKRACFEGFKIAQKRVLKELIDIQQTQKNTNALLKQALRSRNKKLANKYEKELNFLEFQSLILKKLIDSIVWQLLDGEHYIYRRLYTHEKGEKNLSEDSFKFVIDFSEKINKNLDNICIINDITSNIQLGDCIVCDNEGIKIVEIKSGETNFIALDLIEKNELNKETFDPDNFKKDFDASFIKQLERILEQQSKIKKTVNILKNNEGTDPKYPNATVKIAQSTIKIDFYKEELGNQYNSFTKSKKDYSYNCIEGIVHIGIYKRKWRTNGKIIMEGLVEPYYVYDILDGLGIRICEPIFLKYFTDKQVKDLITAKVKIYIGVDINNIIELAKLIGMDAKWSTTKQFHSHINQGNYNPKETYSFQNKGIILSIEGKELFLGQGFFTKMVFDNMTPVSLLHMFSEQLYS